MQRIMMYVPVGEDSPSDRIQLIRCAFSAFSAIGAVFGPDLQEEVRAVAIFIYAGKYHASPRSIHPHLFLDRYAQE